MFEELFIDFISVIQLYQ